MAIRSVVIFANKHARRDKALLRLERELNRLHHAQGNAPVIPLERPYQKGWTKSFVIARKAERHPDAEAFRTVLGVVNRSVRCANRDFVNKKGRPISLHPKIIAPRHWERLAWPSSHQRLFAYGSWRDEDPYSWVETSSRCYTTGFKLIRTWWLEEDLQPYLITHQRVDLPEVRARIAEIENHFSATQGYRRLSWLHGHGGWWHQYESSAAELRHLDAHSLTSGEDT